MAEDTENKNIELNLDFEKIVPWNGQQDTGRDVRLKLDRNWQKVVDAFNTVLEYMVTADYLDNKYLRKDQSDTAAGLITFLKGLFSKDDVIIGTDGYAEGMTGFGTKFGRDGSGEMSRLTLRHELRVPSLVFNQVEILVGDKWRGPGAGVIERVLPDYDEEGNLLNTGTFLLKLEKGQIGAVFTNAICMGIFHDWENSDNNATEDSDDSRGNRTYAGFTTSYFTITEVSDYKDADGQTWHRKQCRYQIRPVSDRWSGQAHPYEQMNFVCYGIFSSDSEMLKKYGTSVYETRAYRRMLWNQNTWEISASNIAYQDGDLSNLIIHGMQMEGYSAYLNSVYFTGTLKQVRPDGTPVQTANDRGEWKLGTLYAFYDRVSWNGGLWLCINENGTNTEPKEGDPSWLCQVKSGASINSAGRWDSNKGPYPVNSIVTFAEKVWISNKETSEPPFGTYLDSDGNRLLFADGGYILTDTLIQSDDWDLLLDTPQLTDGRDGKSLQVRYSSDKTNWHSTFEDADVWMQQRVGEDSMWSAPIRIAGEQGAAGADGTYYDYQFSLNDSLTDAPTSGWQDTPPAVGTGQYLWMRTRLVDPNSEEENPWSVVRIGGEKGDKGDSVSNMGAWKTGMAVPKMGVVTMGGCAFAAKVATTNPPLWCYTDRDGNRLLFSDGGYILTGDVNTEEYDLWVQNGRDGKDGIGKDGAQGIQGCIMLSSEWALNTEYRNDEALTSGTRYINTVLVRNDATETGWDAYKCKKTHVSSAATAPPNSTYWEEYGVNVNGIFTSFILAKNAKIRFLQGNQLLMQKSNGKVTAGLSGSEEGDKTRIWAGSDIPDSAPFSVTEEGVTTSTKFRTARSGLRLEAENGLISVFGSLAKNIEFGVNDEGLAVMRYYDNDGTLLYDLGPSGISSVRRDNDTWSLKRLVYLGVDANAMFGTYWNTAKNPYYRNGEDRWQFLSGFIGNAYNDLENNRKIFKTKSKTDGSGKSNVIEDGWYCDTLPQNITQFNRLQYPTLDGVLPVDMSDLNPYVEVGLPIYVTAAFYIQDGRVFSRQNVYYNLLHSGEDGEL